MVKARQTAWAELGYVVVRDTQLTRDEDGVTQRVLELQRPGAQAWVTLVAVDPATTAIDETWVGAAPKKGAGR